MHHILIVVNHVTAPHISNTDIYLFTLTSTEVDGATVYRAVDTVITLIVSVSTILTFCGIIDFLVAFFFAITSFLIMVGVGHFIYNLTTTND